MLGSVVLDRYVVEEVLGRGAMGTVYRGRHVKLKRSVAIKIMHEHLLGQPELRERFRREASAAGKLSHPNIVGVLDVGEVGGKPVMVMEYARGRSLAAAMSGPVPRVQMLRWVGQLLSGLSHAHGMGLVHRDLKPDNVILAGARPATRSRASSTSGSRSCARPTIRRTAASSPRPGMIVGTPQYMSPEQARAEQVDHRADLYALGIILYEMIAGHHAVRRHRRWRSRSRRSITIRRRSSSARRASSSIACSKHSCAVCSRDVDERFATALTALRSARAVRHDRWPRRPRSASSMSSARSMSSGCPTFRGNDPAHLARCAARDVQRLAQCDSSSESRSFFATRRARSLP